MGSRVQELDQLYILEEIPPEKIYANQSALTEIDRLLQVSKNNNPTKWLSNDELTVKIGFLNSRFIKNKFHNILAIYMRKLRCHTFTSYVSHATLVEFDSGLIN